MHALDIFTPLPSPSDICACVVSISLEMPAVCRKQVGRVSHLTWRENMEKSVLPASGALAAFYIVYSQRHNAAMKVSSVFVAAV